ncbi:hypothetical protein BGW36DRAFT_428181 [Talaromyces proteolyticus]|uniref:DUF1308 domain-containing protein n=1 Tax=Talaromyces proteolyticus TaxID=1131652 RepID=A0AAD4KMH7_9EURO|nr:uncharacterized protein BGW36DRAFT_428181 [Talaromyces proteolyticus]KAH8696162.1 hypothetical protein BGW36DRAFT_428181 [Talaromyces proteolyticus]
MKDTITDISSDAAGGVRGDPCILSSKLIHQCRLLLAELDVFQSAIASRFRKHQQQRHLSETRTLRTNVSSELRKLEKLAAEANTIQARKRACVGEKGEEEGDEYVELSMEESRIFHALRSSNLPFYYTLWTIAKQHCRGVVGFSKRFYWERDKRPMHEREKEAVDVDGKMTKRKLVNEDKKKSVFVDVVHQDGEEWVKISTITENRLVMEMAEKGWGMDSDEEEGDGSYDSQQRTVLRNNDSEEDDDDDQIELIKVASDIVKAAQACRVRYKNPRVRIILSRLEEGKVPEIDHVLGIVRSYGVTVEFGTNIPDILSDEALGDRDPNSISEDDLPLSTLLPNPFEKFTSVVNVDCTILLAVVSDLSHIQQIEPSPSHHDVIRRQIEVEEEISLLTAELWPAMAGHHIVCTKEAVNRMREIVDSVGTDTEKKRATIFLGEGEFQGLSREELVDQFQKLSDHAVPREWALPIKPVEAGKEIDDARQQNRLPPVASQVMEILSDINRSVFFYGWVRNIVTITSNKTVVKQIENVIERNRGDDNNLEGPMVWICDTARSLIGKERNRKP